MSTQTITPTTPASTPAAPKSHTEILNRVMGPCPTCGKTEWWYNDVPLRAFCWGTPEKPHEEVAILVPRPFNPYLLSKEPTRFAAEIDGVKINFTRRKYGTGASTRFFTWVHLWDGEKWISPPLDPWPQVRISRADLQVVVADFKSGKYATRSI